MARRKTDNRWCVRCRGYRVHRLHNWPARVVAACRGCGLVHPAHQPKES